MKIFFIATALLLASFMSAQQAHLQISKLYDNYLSIKNSLVKDDASAAAKSANDFIKTASAIDYKILSEGNVEVLRSLATSISTAKTIDAQRESFHQLSENMILLSEKIKLSEKPVFIQYCPMAEGSWLSDAAQIRNPYYGASMLSCGEVKKVVK